MRPNLTIKEAQRRRHRNRVAVLLLALSMLILALYSVAYKDETKPVQPKVPNKALTRQQQLSSYFRSNGSKTPEEMANAVLQTKSPRLLAAISKIETQGNYKVRNTGYKHQHSGAFQVNARHWGKVPNNAVDQALQAEHILQELTNTLSIDKALSVYGGDSTSKYKKLVLSELAKVPQITQD